MVSAAGCSKEEDDGSGYTFTYTLHGNPQNLDPQLATDRSSLMVIKNMFFMTDGIIITHIRAAVGLDITDNTNATAAAT